jgi:hypothetical protein
VVDLSADGPAGPWHLDRKVPIAFIITIVTGLGSGIWWTSAANGRISALEKSDALTAVRMDTASSTLTVMRERLARIEQMAGDTQDMLRRLDTKIDRLSERK